MQKAKEYVHLSKKIKIIYKHIRDIYVLVEEKDDSVVCVEAREETYKLRVENVWFLGQRYKKSNFSH